MHRFRPFTLAFVTASVFAIASTALAGPQAATAKPAAGGAPIVVMKTSMGEIQIRLNKDKAPVSVENFLEYVEQEVLRRHDLPPGHSDVHDPGRRLHRRHDEEADRTGRSRTRRRTASRTRAARSRWRGRPTRTRPRRSSSSTSVDNPGLDYPKPDGAGYAVFGKVIAGMDVVDKIKAAATTTKAGMRDVPVDAVIIESVRLK